MANNCFWEACILGDRCSESAEVIGRDYTRVFLGEKKVDIVPRFVKYKNLNRKNRKYIDNLSDVDKVDLLKSNHPYIKDKKLTEVMMKGNTILEDFRPLIDDFPGLVFLSEKISRQIYLCW